MYVCTGRIRIGKRVYKLGEPVPVADWPVYAIRNEVALGNLRDVDHEEAQELRELGQRQEESDRRKQLMHRVTAAKAAVAMAHSVVEQAALDLEYARAAVLNAEDKQIELESELELIGPEPVAEPVVVDSSSSDAEIADSAIRKLRKSLIAKIATNLFNIDVSGSKAEMAGSVSSAFAGGGVSLDALLSAIEELEASDG